MREEVIPKIEQAGYNDLANKLRECGYFINVIKCLRCGTQHFGGYNRCKNRFCLNCQHVRSMLYVGRVAERMRENEGLYDYSFLTLTLRDQDNLRDMIKKLGDFWRQLYHSRKEYAKKFKQRIEGYIKSLEVKRGENSGKWHCHFHILVAQSKLREFEKDFFWIRDAWKDITKGEGSVFIKQCKGNLFDIALEVVKYIFKPMNYTIENYSELIQGLEGVRQISTGGVFRGLNKKVEKDMDKVEEKSLDQFVCQRCGFDQGQLESIKFALLKDIILYDSRDYQLEIDQRDLH